jgi:hypothetical protein
MNVSGQPEYYPSTADCGNTRGQRAGLALYSPSTRRRCSSRISSAILVRDSRTSLDGRDLRREPIEIRKHLLAKLLKGSHLSVVLNEHFEEDGAIVFREACRLGCEGIVSKQLGSPYRAGRSKRWIKAKNPKAPAVTARGRGRLGQIGEQNPLLRVPALAEPCGLTHCRFDNRDCRPRKRDVGTKAKPLVTHHQRLCLFEPPSPARRFPPPWTVREAVKHSGLIPHPTRVIQPAVDGCPLVAANSMEIEKVRSFLLQIREEDHAAPLGGIIRVIVSPLVVFSK